MTAQFLLLLLSVLTLFSLLDGIVLHAAPQNDDHHQPMGKGICGGDNEADFDCGDGELRMRCITSLWRCDQIFDCSTGKDELDCSYLHKCPVGHFSCRNGDCFLATHRCDGHDDCGDGWDERACEERPKTAETEDTQSESNVLLPRDDNDQHAASASYDEEASASTVSFLLILTLLLVLLSLVGLVLFRRYPNTASRLSQTLKEFSVTSARSLLDGRFSPYRLHVVISTPGAAAGDNTDQQQFFDNPLHLHQPLFLGVQSMAVRPNIPSPSPTVQPPIV